jgi:hypothetical protein
VTDLGYQPIEPPTHKLAKNRDLVSIDSIQLVGHSEAMHSICDYERGFIPHAYIPYPPSAAERPVPVSGNRTGRHARKFPPNPLKTSLRPTPR